MVPIGCSSRDLTKHTRGAQKLHYDPPFPYQATDGKTQVSGTIDILLFIAPEKLLSDYGKVPAAGAYLDIDARVVGYLTYNIQDSDFRPHIHVDVRLVSANTKAVLYSEQILFGYHNPYLSATQLPSSKQNYYKDFNVLMANKPQALEGLKRGMEAIAGHIASRLKV